MANSGKIMLITVLTALLTAWTYSYADIYQYVDEKGVYHFTNTPDDSKYKKIISEGERALDLKKNSPGDYQQIIQNKSYKYRIEPSLIKAVIKTESNWDPGAISKKGAMGLMQLMPSTAENMDVGNPFNPEENIDGGMRYLRFLLDKFDEDLNLALAAYNAGPEMVERFKGMPPIKETHQYVKRVLSIYNNGSANKTSTEIYKVVYDDGTILYTNTPLPYESLKLSRF